MLHSYSMTLMELLEIKGALPEEDALFYGGCAALAIEHLHDQHKKYAGGVLYRNMTPEMPITLCARCDGFAHEEDFQFYTLQRLRCHFYTVRDRC